MGNSETAVDSLLGPEYKVGVLGGEKVKKTRKTNKNHTKMHKSWWRLFCDDDDIAVCRQW